MRERKSNRYRIYSVEEELQLESKFLEIYHDQTVRRQDFSKILGVSDFKTNKIYEKLRDEGRL